MVVAPGAALRLLPAQVLLTAGDVATEKPAPIVLSRLSVNEVTVAARFEGLVSVMVSVLVAPAPWVAGENALLTLTAVTTSGAVAALALTPAVVISAPAAMLLVYVPAATVLAICTGTVIVQLEFAGIVPAVMVMVVAPGAALRLLVPQVLLAAGDAATEKPAPIVLCKLSVNPLMVAAAAEGLVSVMVSVLVDPAARGVTNVLATLAVVTARLAVAAAVLEPAVVTSPPASTLLVYVPVATVLATCTGTVIVQLPPAGMVPVVMVMVVAPGAALRLLIPQVLLAAGDAATEKPAPIVLSKLSVNPLIVAAAAAEGLVSVMVSVLTCPATWLTGKNALVSVTEVTLRLAVVVVLVPRLLTRVPVVLV
jgi:hypothetical protein